MLPTGKLRRRLKGLAVRFLLSAWEKGHAEGMQEHTWTVTLGSRNTTPFPLMETRPQYIIRPFAQFDNVSSGLVHDLICAIDVQHWTDGRPA